jgi:hypothetical protein
MRLDKNDSLRFGKRRVFGLNRQALKPVGIRFSFSAGYSALQRGFSTCFSPAFIFSLAEAGREARLKPAGTLRGYALSPPAEAGGKEEPAEAGWE